MSASKLSRLASLVLVLAAVFGGFSAVGAAHHETGGSTAESSAFQKTNLETIWT